MFWLRRDEQISLHLFTLSHTHQLYKSSCHNYYQKIQRGSRYCKCFYCTFNQLVGLNHLLSCCQMCLQVFCFDWIINWEKNWHQVSGICSNSGNKHSDGCQEESSPELIRTHVITVCLVGSADQTIRS